MQSSILTAERKETAPDSLLTQHETKQAYLDEFLAPHLVAFSIRRERRYQRQIFHRISDRPQLFHEGTEVGREGSRCKNLKIVIVVTGLSDIRMFLVKTNEDTRSFGRTPSRDAGGGETNAMHKSRVLTAGLFGPVVEGMAVAEGFGRDR